MDKKGTKGTSSRGRGAKMIASKHSKHSMDKFDISTMMEFGIFISKVDTNFEMESGEKFSVGDLVVIIYDNKDNCKIILNTDENTDNSKDRSKIFKKCENFYKKELEQDYGVLFMIPYSYDTSDCVKIYF